MKDKLTRREKSDKIGELLGWKRYHHSFQAKDDPELKGWTDGIAFVKRLPDYFNDLNAMHAAEKVLNEEQWDVYADHLDDMTMYNHGHASRMAHATAKQRAEAFGLTLGLWEAGQ